MQLTLCDSCRRVLDPADLAADLQGGRGAGMGAKRYCADCAPGGPGRPTDVASCSACQVWVVHATLSGGAEPDVATHPICRHCEKNPARTPVPPAQVACAGCGAPVALQALRVGLALPMGERAYCAGCRARPEVQSSELRVERPALRNERTTLNAERTTPNGIGGAALGCDACTRPIDPADLRAGAAAVVEGKLICPRCRGRSARRVAERRASARYVASLVFVLGVFPLAIAALAIVIYRAVAVPGEAPRTATAPAPAPAPAPAAPTGEAASNAELRALFADVLKAIAETERARARAEAAPRVAPGAPVLKPAPDERPAPGPGAAIAKQLGSDAAARAAAGLASDDPGVRLDAVLELGTLTADEAGPALEKALGDPDPIVRAAAAKVAGTLECGAAIDALMQRLGDPDRGVRRSVAHALGRITKTERFYLFEELTDEQLAALRRAIDERRAGGSG